MAVNGSIISFLVLLEYLLFILFINGLYYDILYDFVTAQDITTTNIDT